MINFLLIIVSLGAGVLFNLLKVLPKDSFRSINAWVLYIALPALSLKYIPQIEWNSRMIFPAASPVIVWVGAWLLITLLAKLYPISRETSGALKLSAGLSNTSFLGFPLIAAYYGEQTLSIAIICDQVTFVLLSTVGIITALRSSQQDGLSVKTIVVRALKFPPFIAFILALILPRFMDISPVNPLLDKLVVTMAPLALFSIGLQLKLSTSGIEIRYLSWGLFYKLLIAPALILCFAFLLNAKGIIPRIGVFEAAMPSLVTGSILADQYKLNPQLANLMVGLGIGLAFITSAFWYGVMQLIW